MDYKKAGVDIEAGYKSVELMKACKEDLASGSSWRTRRILGSIFSCEDQRNGRTGAVIRNRRMWNKGQTCHDHG